MRTVRLEIWDYVENCTPELVEVIETSNSHRIANHIKKASEAFGSDDGEFSRVIRVITQDDHGIKNKTVPNPLKR